MRASTAPSARARADRALFCRLRDPGDPLKAPEVVERFLPLARIVAHKHAGGPDTYDDVYQVACVGLVKAVNRFDVARDTAFSTYAVPTMNGEIKRYFRDRTWAVRPPRGLQDLTLRVDRAVDRHRARCGRSPSVADLALELGVDDEAVLEALQARDARHAVSLDVPVADDEDAAALGDLVGGEDPAFGAAERTALTQDLLRVLTPRDRQILELRFTYDMTQAEIGEAVGLSQMQISRILRASLRRLRTIALAMDA